MTDQMREWTCPTCGFAMVAIDAVALGNAKRAHNINAHPTPHQSREED